MSNINGSGSPTWRWIAVTCVAVLLGVGSLLYSQTQARIEKVEDTKASVVQFDLLNERMGRIEDKLDEILGDKRRFLGR